MPSLSWQSQVYTALKAARITQIAYVPDAGHALLIEAAHADRQRNDGAGTLRHPHTASGSLGLVGIPKRAR